MPYAYPVVYEFVIFSQRFVSLRYDIIIFAVSCKVFNFICYDTEFFINFPKRSFNEPVFINPCECA